MKAPPTFLRLGQVVKRWTSRSHLLGEKAAIALQYQSYTIIISSVTIIVLVSFK